MAVSADIGVALGVSMDAKFCRLGMSRRRLKHDDRVITIMDQ